MQISNATLHAPAGPVSGDFVVLRGQEFYRIANYDAMDPFFMSIVSASNHWMFISSKGGLTAGRINADNALFPYYTEDRIHDGSGDTGARTVIRVTGQDGPVLWEPLRPVGPQLYDLSRNLYKHVSGNALVFEEINHDLGLTFRYTWYLSTEFGFVKHSEVINSGTAATSMEVLDGVQNVLPAGVQDAFQARYSVLGDAYKQNELHAGDALATYMLSSMPGDSSDPMESLRATVCWSSVDPAEPRLLSELQLEGFRVGESIGPETRILGRRGAYFVHQKLNLEPGASSDWIIVADLNMGVREVEELRDTLAASADLKAMVMDDVAAGTEELTAIVARSDGLQTTGDHLGSAHHFANVLFNVMRGGIFESGYTIPTDDLRDFIRMFNREVWKKHADFLKGLADEVELPELTTAADAQGDPALTRLVAEYLPLSFSRRHGDPSRPWNRFSIRVRDEDGSRLLAYEGNWRDIFQNWEGLCLSFPEYLEGIVGKFVNTTTADGYNPYRVTREGYEWEIPDPDEPWGNIGYWGDHQLIYLLKLLEWSRAHHPNRLDGLLRDRRFVYADVPYDLRSYEDLLKNPRAAIEYNWDRAERIQARVDALGLDGRFLTTPQGEMCQANLTEKLMVTLLAKLGAFVPGAGFWMNTQRPEWNDANNALAGYGASMVTLCYARRYMGFCKDIFEAAFAGDDAAPLTFSLEVADWLNGTHAIFSAHRTLAESDTISDADRKSFLDEIGGLAGSYRAGVYRDGLSGDVAEVAPGVILELFEMALVYMDQSIALSRRDDGLYHAYNVLEIGKDGIGVRNLYPMLEGQVAVLSSGALAPAEVARVMAALRASDIYRENQHSYMLYPNRVLPGFLEKNIIPAELASKSSLFAALVEAGDWSVVQAGRDGRMHFDPDFRNVGDLNEALEALREEGYGDLVDAEGDLIREIWEAVFQHLSYTGRSGTFYGYEGLGSIYWHMVSKLLLAVQESAQEAGASGDPAFSELADWYYDVRKGIGFNKTPDVYGAFPTDPYSHTPGQGGARQPGMTGQVKEEIISRRSELGLEVAGGCIVFDPTLLRASEFLSEADTLDFFDVAGERRRLELDAGSFGYTCCQVPVVCHRGADLEIRVTMAGGETITVAGGTLDKETSQEIFRRSGKVVRLDVVMEPRLQS